MFGEFAFYNIQLLFRCAFFCCLYELCTSEESLSNAGLNFFLFFFPFRNHIVCVCVLFTSSCFYFINITFTNDFTRIRFYLILNWVLQLRCLERGKLWSIKYFWNEYAKRSSTEGLLLMPTIDVSVVGVNWYHNRRIMKLIKYNKLSQLTDSSQQFVVICK